MALAKAGTAKSLLLLVSTWIIGGIKVFEAQRTNGRYLGDVLTGFCPVEVGRIAGQNDDAAGRIRIHLVAVEPIAQADVENAGHDRVHSVLRVPVWHQPHAGGHFDPDHVGAGLCGLTDNDGEADRGRERREWLPVDLFGQDRSENGMARLVSTNHCGTVGDAIVGSGRGRPQCHRVAGAELLDDGIGEDHGRRRQLGRHIYRYRYQSTMEVGAATDISSLHGRVRANEN